MMFFLTLIVFSFPLSYIHLQLASKSWAHPWSFHWLIVLVCETKFVLLHLGPFVILETQVCVWDTEDLPAGSVIPGSICMRHLGVSADYCSNREV